MGSTIKVKHSKGICLVETDTPVRIVGNVKIKETVWNKERDRSLLRNYSAADIRVIKFRG